MDIGVDSGQWTLWSWTGVTREDMTQRGAVTRHTALHHNLVSSHNPAKDAVQRFMTAISNSLDS